MSNNQEPQYIVVSNRKRKQQSAQPTAEPDDWPQSLKDYVAYSFSNCLPGKRPAIEQELRDMILKASQANVLQATDWNERDLPSAAGGIRNPKATKPSASSQKLSEGAKRSKFSGVDSIQDTPEERLKREQRKNRFKDQSPLLAKAKFTTADGGEEIEWQGQAVVGTCTNLEKPYYRLTSAADPATVRPLAVLKQSFTALRKKWKKKEDYEYICEQFKSIRQDLAVQNIRNEFTVKVYQTHARIALEKDDLGEFNQCQTQLKFLYESGQLGGQPEEFIAYRILYYIYVRSQQDLNILLNEILHSKDNGKPAKKKVYVQHALNVRSALATGNYVKFFQLYREAQNFPILLDRMMDQFVKRERVTALKVICKAYKLGVPMMFVAETLAFDSVKGEFNRFLEECGIVQSQAEATFDTKAALSALILQNK